MQHCAINVVIYDRKRTAWAMTEHPRGTVDRTPDALQIGASSFVWEGDTLVIRFDERTAPLGRRVRGVLRLYPEQLVGVPFNLDIRARHAWWPIAPVSRFEARLAEPAASFKGTAYHDANLGSEPLEATFRQWTWSRATTGAGTAVIYDVDRRVGSSLRFARFFGQDGRIDWLEAPAQYALAPTRWRLPRGTRGEAGADPRLVEALEDTPFYSRSLLATRIRGQPALAVHESLDLDRFTASWVRFLIRFRMRRVTRWRP